MPLFDLRVYSTEVCTQSESRLARYDLVHCCSVDVISILPLAKSQIERNHSTCLMRSTTLDHSSDIKIRAFAFPVLFSERFYGLKFEKANDDICFSL